MTYLPLCSYEINKWPLSRFRFLSKLLTKSSTVVRQGADLDEVASNSKCPVEIKVNRGGIGLQNGWVQSFKHIRCNRNMIWLVLLSIIIAPQIWGFRTCSFYRIKRPLISICFYLKLMGAVSPVAPILTVPLVEIGPSNASYFSAT